MCVLSPSGRTQKGFIISCIHGMDLRFVEMFLSNKDKEIANNQLYAPEHGRTSRSNKKSSLKTWLRVQDNGPGEQKCIKSRCYSLFPIMASERQMKLS